MKKSKQLVIAMLAVLAVSVSFGALYPEANAQSTTTPSLEKTLSVTGMATASVDPDLLTVNFGIEIQKPTAKQALEENSKMMKNVISALKSVGITESEISTSSLNIYPVYEYISDEFLGIQTRELVGYKVSNILSVETEKLNLAATIIDNGVDAGVNRVDSVYYSLSPQKQMDLKDDLLEQAITNAESKAKKALIPLEHIVIGVKSISLSEFGMPYPQPVFSGDFAMSESKIMASTPVFSSEQDITTSVQVVFLIGSN
ncbi:MAG: hypothetical protein CO032_00625 [Nitrosopumilales archaeon CG_4_9_14_0_2_um_filter_34_16]|nr:MAG: hypothetical protein CO032_00625 [Nitrosopumilales archaeon CG_4_9_14_0_2_um_filter_34_16]